MKVWVAIIPDNELLGVFTSKELCQKAIDECERSKQWAGWGSMEPFEAEVDDGVAEAHLTTESCPVPVQPESD